MTRGARIGDRLRIALRVATEDGVVHDEVTATDPLEFTLGDPILLPALTTAIVGEPVGARRDIELPPERAYGESDPRRRKTIPRAHFPGEPRIGAVLDAVADEGRIPLRVLAHDDATVTLDANPPLAGRTLRISFEILSLEPGTYPV